MCTEDWSSASWPATVSSSCSRLRRTAVGSPLGILGTHVRIAHQHDRVLASLPGTHFQAVLVVVVVSALALRHVAPGSGHVPGGEDVLQEVKRKRFIGQHRECEGGALFRVRFSRASLVAFCSALR